jgi:phospholipid N-methyltransferase
LDTGPLADLIYLRHGAEFAASRIDGLAARTIVLVAAGHRLVKAAALAGAVAPSSKYLAAAMARAAHGAAALVELGAGRGPVTRALADAHPGLRLVIVELRKDLAAALRREFRTAEVHAAPAAPVLRKLSDLPAATALISSLPFRSLPKLLKQETVGSVLDFLRDGRGRFMLQFTYYPGVPFQVPVGFRWRKVAFIALNLPPATVWLLEPEPAMDHRLAA